jgi:GNAT superfamily N-acetyltransferase
MPSVRLYRQETDATAVRRIWPSGLLGNIGAFSYPPSLVAEEEEFVRETLATGDMTDLQAAYQADKRTNFWVAVKGEGSDDPVGCVGLRLGKEASVADLGRFAVDSAHRGCGVARLLLGAAEAHAREAGFTRVTATTCGLNTPALATFGACGFKQVYRGRMDGKPEPEFVPFVRVEKVLRVETAAAPSYTYTIRPMQASAFEQAAIKQMYLDNYNAYVTHACGVGDCKCADLGAGMKRYTERYCGDMDDLAASHLSKGGQFWVVEATPANAAEVEYAGCVGCKRVDDQLTELHRLSVSPAHRRKGLARQLVQAVETWVQEKGFIALFLTTWPPRGCPGTAASSDLYSKTGFEVIQQGSPGPRVFVKAMQLSQSTASLPAQLRDAPRLMEIAKS